jgi:hypothetical protein
MQTKHINYLILGHYLTVSPQFWGYFVGAIMGWYLGVWFGPKRARLNI